MRCDGLTAGAADLTAGAVDAMEPVFVYDRLGRRYLGHRMPKRFRILAVEIVAVPATVRRPTLDDLAELFGRDQSPRMMAMSRLPTSFLPRGRNWRSAFDRRWVGRRGLGRVGGVLAEPFLQIGDPLLEGLHQRRDRRSGFECEGTPDGWRERWLILHADVVLISQCDGNSGP